LKNSELANSNNFYNVDWDKVGNVVETVKDTIGGKGSKDPKETLPKPTIKETTILGMHPMTMIIATVSILGLSILGIVIYRKIKINK
jgi:hypothetical protein